MAPSRRRNNSSLFESSTIITANLIMASSSYLLSRVTPRATASPTRTATARAPAWSSATSSSTRSAVEPMAGSRTVLMEPIDGLQDGMVDQQAETFIRRFRERTQSETARLEAAAAGSIAAVRPPQPPVSSTMWAGTVHRFPR